MSNPNNRKYFSLIIFIFGFSVPIFTSAATLNFSAGQGYEIGSNFSVQVLVSTETAKPLNAVSATVSFPKDKLELVSVSKAGSIINFWAEEPKFSNTQGTANVEGVVLNPGWSGSGGKVAILNFKVKSMGTANITFTSASILANDGQGTNILTSASPISITLKDKVEIDTEPKVVEEPVLIATTTPVLATSTPVVEVIAQIEDPKNEPADFEVFTKLLLNYLSLVIIVIVVLALIIALIIYLFYRLKKFKNKFYRRVQSVEKGVHHDFEVLREELEAYMDRLVEVRRKRDLTKEEKLFMINFKKYIGMVEKDVISKLDSIEKEVDE